MFKKLFKKYLDAPDTPLSESDQLLRQFDREHPEKSASQLKEIAKAKRIATLQKP